MCKNVYQLNLNQFSRLVMPEEVEMYEELMKEHYRDYKEAISNQ